MLFSLWIAPSSLYLLGALAVGWQQVEHLVCLNPVIFLQRPVVCLYAWPLENVVVSCVLSLLERSSSTIAVWGGGEDHLCLWDPLCMGDQLLHPGSFWLGCTCSLSCWFRSQKSREDQQSSTPIFTTFPQWVNTWDCQGETDSVLLQRPDFPQAFPKGEKQVSSEAVVLYYMLKSGTFSIRVMVLKKCCCNYRFISSLLMAPDSVCEDSSSSWF